MTDKNFDNAGSDAGRGDDEVRPNEEGAEAQASAPTPSEPELTIDDILGAEQNVDAAAEDAALNDHESALLGDLKRLQAEYANYRRRTEDQREVEIERAKGSVAKNLLPVLDDLDRAAKHGDLVDGTPFAAIAEKMRSIAERVGLSTYGAVGDVFDPQQHEAIFQQPTPGATETTVLDVVEVGYRLGSIELRPAKVVVAVPAD
ncbi:nucleotide exchange factor GrpE [Microbacterium sp. cx-55]|uniref:nucleotide exchange factor GrpE n=1 Tax=unclassified Microbacterium TaxID=2609290 RepID=UPI001CBC8CFC|nr:MULTISPECIES: nucleotide exchange factor GrpE [unclassified Microbacterium]MBZ4488437.1 nucleotide exchange factor GrpE [Microbacterium sp. cx-55]MCC4909500.1 nucleotide exchange factor GrpE [Microbacterium sp. cx-59]UGB35085.1 nucleotide exchange factor GrpE [Microbacterium sp. cx-55]